MSSIGGAVPFPLSRCWGQRVRRIKKTVARSESGSAAAVRGARRAPPPVPGPGPGPGPAALVSGPFAPLVGCWWGVRGLDVVAMDSELPLGTGVVAFGRGVGTRAGPCAAVVAMAIKPEGVYAFRLR